MPLSNTKKTRSSRKRTLTAKKRLSGDHKKRKSRLKSYWPYIPMLLIVGTGIFLNNLWSSGSVLGQTTNITSAYLLDATNNDRSKAQKTPFTLNAQLSSAAQTKADDMAKKNYWAHNSPNGDTPWVFIEDSGYHYKTAGENLAYGFASAESVVNGWMNSESHRANILNEDYRHVGFGVAYSPNFQNKGPQTIVVAEYAEPVDAVANINFSVPNTAENSPASVKSNMSKLDTQPVSRIQAITAGRADWSALLLSAITGAALALFIVRHGRRLHRVISQGERFVAKHPFLDIAAVFIFTACYLLTRTIGIIG